MDLKKARQSIMVVPNFLFIGPDKSGSTWIYHILGEHPECCVTTIKETFYFNQYYHRGMDWYLSFFAGGFKNIRAAGEICHDYLFSDLAATRIKYSFPKIKLITCLRNPTERTFSHYLYLVRSGLTKKPIEDALDDFPELLDNSLYYKHLSKYFAIFDFLQIKILLFEQLKNDPEEFAHELFEIIGVSFCEEINYHTKVLPASRPRSFVMAYLAKKGANAARKLALENIVGVIKTSFVSRLLYTPYKISEKPRLSMELKGKLIDYFRSDIENLERLLDRDFSNWLIL